MKAVPKALTFTLAAATALSALALTAAPAEAAVKDCGLERAVGLEAVALTKNMRLLCVHVDTPGQARVLGKVGPLDAGTRIVDIDYRSENGKLYGLGSNGALYTISAKNAKATKVSNGITVDGNPFTLSGTYFGIDFNTAVDRLRVISDTGLNMRINPNDGVGFSDVSLTNTVPGGGATGVTDAAYTNTDKMAFTDTANALFDIDTTLDRLSQQIPPNTGQLTPQGPLGRNVDPDNGFDIYSYWAKGKARRNVAFAAVSDGTRSTLVQVDLFAGGLTSQGKFAKGFREIIGLALPLNQR